MFRIELIKVPEPFNDILTTEMFKLNIMLKLYFMTRLVKIRQQFIGGRRRWIEIGADTKRNLRWSILVHRFNLKGLFSVNSYNTPNLILIISISIVPKMQEVCMISIQPNWTPYTYIIQLEKIRKFLPVFPNV